jgi:hypothetical protein
LFGLALRRAGTLKLGGATIVVAAFALLGAIDHGLADPVHPVSPALVRAREGLGPGLGATLIGHKKTATDPSS